MKRGKICLGSPCLKVKRERQDTSMHPLTETLINRDPQIDTTSQALHTRTSRLIYLPIATAFKGFVNFRCSLSSKITVIDNLETGCLCQHIG